MRLDDDEGFGGDWGTPIASNGDSLEHVRACLQEQSEAAITATIHQLRAEGLGIRKLERIQALLERTQAEAIESRLGMILREMATSCGALPAELH